VRECWLKRKRAELVKTPKPKLQIPLLEFGI